jgi:hypothetical protein
MGDGVRAHTPWGEVAFQLAGKEGYEIVRRSDEEHVAPGADTISELFGSDPVLKLKTGATRAQRKRTDGTISRGPRKFFTLLGVENAPRLKQTGLVHWGGTTRTRELRAAQAEQVPADWISPDLERVLAAFPKLSKKDLRERSPALFKAMARAWERSYANRKMVASQHEARVYVYPKAPVTAQWLIQLRETPWVAIGKGELVTPNEAVVRTQETQTLYASTAFAVGIDLGDYSADFAVTLGLVTSVRVGDLVKLLRETRDGVEAIDDAQVMAIYRNIAKYVPRASCGTAASAT